MSIEITMPRLSDTMERGTIIKWHVAEGDEVTAGDVLADVETDKATMEMQSFDDGVVAGIKVPEGQAVDVGTVCAILSEDDDAAAGDQTQPTAAEPAQPAPAPETTPSHVEVIEAAAVRTSAGGSGRPDLRITPVARRLAEAHGVDPATLQGTGPSGRITKKDVLAAAETTQEVAAAVPPSAAPADAVPVESPALAPIEQPGVPSTPVSAGGQLALHDDDRREPVSGMRQTIARRLVQSKQEIPHYQVAMSFDMDALVELRSRLNSELAEYEVKLSMNDLIVRACALAMARNPLMNASWDTDAIVYHNRVHMGVAVALPEERGGGLVVPVIHDADRRSLRSISAQTRALAAKARDRGLSPEDMEGATFTVSNLGMFGVDDFTAIINPPNSAILAVGATLQKPVVRDGELAVGWVMKATLSNDHRVVDGATAARWLNTLKELIEHPSAILV
ncbi:MAG: 2-oxo acid dehydrogenase subunit E2 [Phycisphaerales bacterium]|nr:2-oxo acid dehydrogenase subunit E2 [Phycisphaerales bacterium]